MKKIRFAKECDALELLRIYKQYIDTTITFEYVLPSEEEFRRRIREFSEVYPYLVYEEDGKILGYAYAHRAFERAAFQWDAEVSIYLDREIRGRGIGKICYQVLLNILKEQGVITVYSLISTPNPRSEKLHLDMGFELIGVHKNTGFKAGKWCDISWYQLQLNPYSENPVPIKTVHELEQETIREILETI